MPLSEKQRAKAKAARLRRYAANPEKYRKLAREWQTLNREKARQSSRNWWAKNKGKRAAAAKLWRQNNPERFRELKLSADHRRRARKAGQGGSHTVDQWVAMGEAAGWVCEYCFKQLSRGTATRDHRVPIARGGTDDIANIAVCCRSCNSKKRTMDALEFAWKVFPIRCRS